MNTRRKVNYKSVLAIAFVIFLLYGLTMQGVAAFHHYPFLLKNLTFSKNDTIPQTKQTRIVPRQLPVKQKQDSSSPVNKGNVNDSIPQQSDSLFKDSTVQKIDTFNLKISKDSIDAPVEFKADDSMVIDIPGKKIYLYNKAEVKFKDVSLNAAVIQLDQPTQILTAFSMKDTAGKRDGVPAFKQGESAFTADTIRYNFKTQHGLTIGSYTQEGEMFIYGERVKRITPSEFFAEKARFSSCNYDTPHFAFRAKKVKFISNKMAVTGPIYPEFEGVPLRIVSLPFGIFPMKQGRRTGILSPSPVANDQLGFGLEGLGYYKTFGDYWDATIRTNIYSYGSFNVFLSPTYRKRYRYSGAFNLSYMNTKIGFKGDPDYVPPSRNFAIQWSHSLDGKARPGQTFSANVNVATSLFNKLFPSNTQQNFNNSLSSSIAYQRTWAGESGRPSSNLTVSANHNQNTNTKLFNVNLPDIGYTINTFYPFQKKEFVGTPKWYEKLGVSYSGSFQNQFAFYDSTFTLKHLIDTFDWSARHSIPIQLSLPPMGPIQMGPSISYNETWHSRAYSRTWDPASKSVQTETTKGFYREKQMSFGMSFSTALFGKMDFKKSGHVQAIRHVIRPSLGMSYTPDLNKGNWYQTQVDSLGNKLWFNKLNGGSAASAPDGRSGAISFALDNNLEMKVRDKKDTSEEGIKKVKLIDGFGLSTSYNLLADSFALSDFNFYLRSNLFEKISLTASANVTPYQVDPNTGFRINKYTWQGGQKFALGRFTSGFISVNTSFKSKPKDEKKQKEKEQYQKDKQNDFDDNVRQMGAIQKNPEEYVDFNIPWSINVSYSLNLNRQLRTNLSGFETKLTQSLNLSGDFSLTEKWKFQGSCTFDIQTKSVQYLTTSISRDLHCWQLAINVSPIGIYRSFSITINPKSSLLRDLRINRSRSFYNLSTY